MKFIIFLIIAAGLFLRVYRLPDLLGFYYDQGRDALVIWELLHNHKIFLIGPTTGIEGIFLGPFYYYFITPFYYLGRGNPLFPAVFLSLINTVALVILYRLSSKTFGRLAGLFTVTFAAFSYYNIYDQRWLSNPNPLTFFSLLVYWFVYQLILGKNYYLPLVSFLIGLCLQFEAASAVFFIPSILITLFLFRKSVKITFRQVLLSLVAFAITLAPQLLFDLRHQHLLINAFKNFLVTNKSFTGSIASIYPDRLVFFYHALTQRFFLRHALITPLFSFIFFLQLIKHRSLFHHPMFKLSLVWIITPLVFLAIYTGNHGFVWDYYLTGIYPLIFIIVSVVLTKNRKLAFVSMLLFLILNLGQSYKYLTQPLSHPQLITLGNSLKAVDWVYENSQTNPFNVDVYVPPVIPYAYDYLFLWRGTTKYGLTPKSSLVNNLYTLFEVDGEHPQYLTRWLDRQATIGVPQEKVQFGGVTVERRTRLPL